VVSIWKKYTMFYIHEHNMLLIPFTPFILSIIYRVGFPGIVGVITMLFDLTFQFKIELGLFLINSYFWIWFLKRVKFRIEVEYIPPKRGIFI